LSKKRTLWGIGIGALVALALAWLTNILRRGDSVSGVPLVRAAVKISDTAGGFGGVLDDHDIFGRSVAAIGDLDSDGVTELAVGALGDDDGGEERGAVWILFLDRQGSVKKERKISSTQGSFGGGLHDGDLFGVSVASLGDLDGDGVTELAVGAPGDDDGGEDRGAVWVLFLAADGSVRSKQKISSLTGGFSGALDAADLFGYSMVKVDDLDGDGVTELAVGVRRDDDGGVDRGAVWVLFLAPDGTVRTQQKISSLTGGLEGPLDDDDLFGVSVTSLADLDGDGALPIWVTWTPTVVRILRSESAATVMVVRSAVRSGCCRWIATAPSGDNTRSVTGLEGLVARSTTMISSATRWRRSATSMGTV
jgi:hypothetical protein